MCHIAPNRPTKYSKFECFFKHFSIASRCCSDNRGNLGIPLGRSRTLPLLRSLCSISWLSSAITFCLSSIRVAVCSRSFSISEKRSNGDYEESQWRNNYRFLKSVCILTKSSVFAGTAGKRRAWPACGTGRAHGTTPSCK